MSEALQWRRCSACKKPLPFDAPYWICNVSTCNRPRTGLAFCSVECWEVHLPTANHREAWALERRSPAAGASADAGAEQGGGRRRLVRPAPAAASAPRKPAVPKEVLIIASRLKDYVRARSGFNTSDRVLEPLSEIVRRVCEEAIANATRDGRRTVLDRDIPDA